MVIQQLYQIFESELKDAFSTEEVSSLWRWVKEELESDAPYESLEGQLEKICVRLLNGEPIQYITGRAFFYGMELKVNHNVLIPRPETEELVYYALRDLRPKQKVMDIGTGSGCIPILLKHKMPDLVVWACDISPIALEVANANADLHDVSINTFAADLTDLSGFEVLPEMDMIISNPPYIIHEEKGAMTSNTSFEPDIALFSPEDALWAYRHIRRISEHKLKSGGLLYFELNEFKAGEILVHIEQGPFEGCEIIDDMQGKPRILRAVRI